MTKTSKILLHCAVCNADILRYPSTAKSKHGAVFCSSECQYKGRTLGLTKRIVTAPYNYTPEGKANMIKSSKTPRGKRVYHILTCTNCNESFDDPNYGRKRKSNLVFCSLACCNSYRTGKNNPAWRGGHPEYYGPDWRRLRREARIRDNYSCKRCHKDMKPPHRLPDVHHIKPVISFENANDAHYLDNLVCLCHTCHMYAEWHGIDF